MTRRALLLAFAVLASCAPAPKPLAAAPLPPQLAGRYDTQNPFARIIRGELPAAKVYEDKNVLAFMDNHPAATGHVLVISKTSHARNLLEIDPADLAQVMAVVQRVTRAEFTALGADGVTIVQNNGSAQTVFHLHVHVIPRTTGVPMPIGPNPQASLDELRPIAAKLAAAIAAQ